MLGVVQKNSFFFLNIVTWRLLKLHLRLSDFTPDLARFSTLPLPKHCVVHSKSGAENRTIRHIAVKFWNSAGAGTARGFVLMLFSLVRGDGLVVLIGWGWSHFLYDLRCSCGPLDCCHIILQLNLECSQRVVYCGSFFVPCLMKPFDANCVCHPW